MLSQRSRSTSLSSKGLFTPSNLILGFLVLINICVFLWRASYSIHPQVLTDDASFIGRDYPIMLDVGDLDRVAMTLHESVRFTLGDGTDEAIGKTWGTLFANPPGLGRVHLGQDDRLFAATFVHQLHCVRELARAFHHPRTSLVTKGHQQHCLTYLRQTLLCDAPDTLEEGDFTQRNFEVDRVGGTAVCWDWEKVYGLMGQSYRDWQARKASKHHVHSPEL